MPLLSKSNYMNGLQCPRYLWMRFHHPEKLPQPTAAEQRRFDQGHLVGELAQKLFPKGILVEQDNFKENIKKTEELLEKRKALFEAGILVENLYSRADVLNPVGRDEWDVVEVKSSTKVKPEHVLDVAFQKYVYLKFGLKIRKCFLMCIETSYVKKGKIEPKKLFKKEDITSEVNKAILDVEENIKRLFEILALEKPPEFQLMDLETSFYDHPVIDEFKESLPAGSVFELYRGGKKCRELFGQKVCLLVDIPEEYKLTGHQQIQKKCAKTGRLHLDKVKLGEFFGKLEYPLYFLDFETFQTAIPLFEGTKPYQQIPFQYSLHVVESEKTKPKHFSFLADGAKDQRKEFLSSLKENLGDKGSIIVYNQSFEKRILKELAEVFPKEKKWVEAVFERVVDLWEPFKKFYYYHPKQMGSASLKYVLPVLTKKSYQKLEISNGEDASLQFLTIAFEEVTEKEKERVREALEKYCGLDTEGMVWIVGELRELTK